MKKILIVFALPIALMSGELKKGNVKAPAAKAQTKPEAAPSIPAGAVEVEPFTYRFVDAQGKKWIYRQTPFGVVKKEDKPEVQPAVESAPPVNVTDLGDSVKFERAMPFGTQTWTRKKADLTSDEKSMVERSKPAEKR